MLKHKDTSILLYWYLKDEPQKDDMQLNQLLTQLVEKNKTEMKMVVEWIVKEIEQEDAKEAVDLFLQEFVWFHLINIVMTCCHQCYDTCVLWYDCLMS